MNRLLVEEAIKMYATHNKYYDANCKENMEILLIIARAYLDGKLCEVMSEYEILDFLDNWAYRQGNMLKCNDDDLRKIAHAIADAQKQKQGVS